MAAKKRQRRSAFVPKLLVRTAVASVVPACALGCGGSTTTMTDGGGDDVFHGVAAVGYPAYDASKDQRSDFGVAAVAYPAYEAGNDAGQDTGTGGDAKPDVFFGVAAVAYPAYEAGSG